MYKTSPQRHLHFTTLVYNLWFFLYWAEILAIYSPMPWAVTSLPDRSCSRIVAKARADGECAAASFTLMLQNQGL